MKIAIGSDHRGFRHKEAVAAAFAASGHEIVDCGCPGEDSADYPDAALAVAELVGRNEAGAGVLICGSGIGMSIAANKVHGVRAAVCTDSYSARVAREHNDANILCLGARVTGAGLVEEIVRTFLRSGFEGGRHAKRVEKIHLIESASPGEPRSGC
jgi:ribose 5-phosphate isomerase B